MAFCTNCGQELEQDAKFCAECGKATNKNNQTNEQRKTIYDGKIHKCPNCGEVLSSFVVQCPACGYEIRDAVVSNAVSELALKLEHIGNERPNKKVSLNPFKVMSNNIGANSISEQKVSLIRNFSIPNTKEDIMEFMILASSNIDMKLYGFGNQGVLTASQRELSDAWLAKFEQAYQKAKILLKGEEFQNIHNIYTQTNKKLKLEKLKVPLSIICPFIFCFFIIVFCLIMAQFE